MLLKRSTSHRALVASMTAVLLAACSTFVADPAPGPQHAPPQTVSLSCYWKFRLQAIDECHVSAVDGQRPAVSQVMSLKTELAPGPHWVEFRMQHTVGFGGTMDVCAFEHDFLAGHHYRILPRSFSRDVERPWRFAAGLYTGSVDLEERRHDGTVTVQRPALTCTASGALCRTTSDCGDHPDVVCEPQPGYAYGRCRKK